MQDLFHTHLHFCHNLTILPFIFIHFSQSAFLFPPITLNPTGKTVEFKAIMSSAKARQKSPPQEEKNPLLSAAAFAPRPRRPACAAGLPVRFL